MMPLLVDRTNQNPVVKMARQIALTILNRWIHQRLILQAVDGELVDTCRCVQFSKDGIGAGAPDSSIKADRDRSAVSETPTRTTTSQAKISARDPSHHSKTCSLILQNAALVSRAGFGEGDWNRLLHETDQEGSGSASNSGGDKAREDECAHHPFLRKSKSG